MGTMFAPTYATLSIGQFILNYWCRFLDDRETPLDKTKIDPNRLTLPLQWKQAIKNYRS